LDASRDRLFYAALGEGAYVDQKPISVAAARPLSRCFLVTGFYYMKGEDLEREIARFARVAQSCQSIRRDGAAALDLALAAEGIFDAFWEVGLQPWDVAAGALLVQEAGGHVRNYDDAGGGRSYNIERPGIIAGSAAAVSQIGELL
jgi:myo-inositol-1(or 4)-monophosphatase